jgi:hypothetical protein
MEPAYADEVVARIGQHVETMTDDEIAHLERIEIPPLEAPPPSDRRARAPVAVPHGAATGTFPREIKALYRLLKTRLRVGTRTRWGAYRLDDVFLRPGDPAVALWLSVVPGARVPPADAGLLVRVFRITRPEDLFHARLGSLGIFAESSGPADERVVTSIVSALKRVFVRARRELEPARSSRRRRERSS